MHIDETTRGEVTGLLLRAQRGEPLDSDALLPLVYQELHALASHHLAQERPDHTLQATALVHEAYLKLVDGAQIDWTGRTHFLATCAQAMRRILVSSARARKADKRGGGRVQVLVGEDPAAPIGGADAQVVRLHEALERLEAISPRQSKVVELRYFGGMTEPETAAALDVSERTVRREWVAARAWLRREVQSAHDETTP